ncbi:hypothetical protein AUG19_04880 [archaeon 13_1_20CM_2_54_9]|nr:MAG: hypothetical protein AUJ07_06210 [Crenarchaeota archaeon 13_1_40CM_3_53_5]OLE75657.1 MAG: hypothetical protein AUG19_04880 [archaeon 13_1_20CM_2_54_9]
MTLQAESISLDIYCLVNGPVRNQRQGVTPRDMFLPDTLVNTRLVTIRPNRFSEIAEGVERHVEGHDRSNSGRADAAFVLAFTILGFLAGWVAVEYLHNVYLQQYLGNIVRSSGSLLRFGLPMGVGVFLVTVSVFLRGRWNRRFQSSLGRGAKIHGITVDRMVSHPLFLFERPARDSKFILRKTRTSGRISRVRGAERLPLGELP